MAEKLDAELKKSRNREKRPVHDISPEDAGTYREF